MNMELGLSQWWPLATVLAAVSALLVIRGYRHQIGRVPIVGWLKLAALWLLTWWLLEPLHVVRSAPPQANVVLVVVDDTRSMQARTLKDGSPAEVLRDLLCARSASVSAQPPEDRAAGPQRSGGPVAPRSPALDSRPRFDEQLAEHFRVRRFAAGERLRALAGYHELRFAEVRSPLRRHLHDLAAAFREEPVGGILLFSDGGDSEFSATPRGAASTTGATDAGASSGNGDGAASAGREAAPLPPVFPVQLGRAAERPNVAIVDAHVTETLFEDAPVTLSVEILARHAQGRSVRAAVFDAAGALIEQRVAQVADDASGLQMLFRLSERVRRTAFARVQIALADEWEPRGARPAATPADRLTRTAGRPGAARAVSPANHEIAGTAAASSRESGSQTDNPPPFVLAPGGPAAGILAEAAYTTEEVTLADNDRAVALRPETRRHRILYVAGRPNWEWKFLRRAVEEDPHLQLTGLIRIARREAKFDFRGRRGERTNALFRGFEAAGDEAEQYDEPVFLRLNTPTPEELRGGFPTTAEQLFDFEAVILDDIEASFFTREQLALLQRFVSERGGSLLMLGGVDTFRHGGYHKTVLADVLPVYMDRVAPPQSPDDRGRPPQLTGLAQRRSGRGGTAPPPRRENWSVSVRLRKTRQGRVEPWMRLRESLEQDARQEAAIPAFHIVTPARTIKAAATELARFETPAGQVLGPALVAHRFGRGRAVAFLAGDLWRWRLKSPAENNDGERFWRQLCRWLVADVSPRHELVLERSDDAVRTLRCLVRCRNRAFTPDDRSTVTIDVFCSGTPAGATTEPADYLDEAPFRNGAAAVLPSATPHNEATATRARSVRPAGFGAGDAAGTVRAASADAPLASAAPSSPGPRRLPPGRWQKLCTLAARPVDGRPGVYEVRFLPPDEALLWVVARIRPGEPDGTIEPDAPAAKRPPILLQAGWVEQPRHGEFRPLQKDTGRRLRALAEDTGGAVVPVEKLESFIRELPHRAMPVHETRREPLWHSPWMLLAALTCTIGEWFWRRRHGLA